MMLLYFLGIILLALFAYKKESLTKGGAITAVMIATIILLGFSLFGLILLAVFFFSSSLLGKIRPSYSHQDDSSMIEKGNRRDAYQVLANGAWPALMALLFLVTSQLMWYYSFIAVLAAVTSDTWASEIGKHSRRKPVHLLTLKTIPAGQSGGMSVLGTISALLGSFFIVAVASTSHLFQEIPDLSVSIGLVLAFIGFLGQFVDTIVGATIQRLNKCRVCSKETERFVHCGKETIQIKGLSFMTNDMVNHACSLSAVGLTVIYASLII